MPSNSSPSSPKLRLFLPAATEVQGSVEAGLMNEPVGMQVDTTDIVIVLLTVVV